MVVNLSFEMVFFSINLAENAYIIETWGIWKGNKLTWHEVILTLVYGTKKEVIQFKNEI